MSEITLDAATAAAVARSATATPVRGPDGSTVGYVVSPEVYESIRKAVIEWAKAQATNEELLRRAAQGGTKTMDDVFKLLEG